MDIWINKWSNTLVDKSMNNQNNEQANGWVSRVLVSRSVFLEATIEKTNLIREPVPFPQNLEEVLHTCTT